MHTSRYKYFSTVIQPIPPPPFTTCTCTCITDLHNQQLEAVQLSTIMSLHVEVTAPAHAHLDAPFIVLDCWCHALYLRYK